MNLRCDICRKLYPPTQTFICCSGCLAECPECARKDELIAALRDVFWSAEELLAGWHPNLDIRERMSALTKNIQAARARLAEVEGEEK